MSCFVGWADERSPVAEEAENTFENVKQSVLSIIYAKYGFLKNAECIFLKRYEMFSDIIKPDFINGIDQYYSKLVFKIQRLRIIDKDRLLSKSISHLL